MLQFKMNFFSKMIWWVVLLVCDIQEYIKGNKK